jgi:hypothetical protein
VLKVTGFKQDVPYSNKQDFKYELIHYCEYVINNFGVKVFSIVSLTF